MEGEQEKQPPVCQKHQLQEKEKRWLEETWGMFATEALENTNVSNSLYI